MALVADKNMESALKGLLPRQESLGIRRIQVDVFVHPLRDPGCLRNPETVLAPLQSRYQRALVMFDRDGCGQHDRNAMELAHAVEQRLAQCGWADRVGAVVIDPELENWVWAQSPHVDRVLGWAGREPGLRTWLMQESFLAADGASKPSHPKEAVEQALRIVKKPRSSAIYEELARVVTLASCADPAFLRLRRLLTSWFPAEGGA